MFKSVLVFFAMLINIYLTNLIQEKEDILIANSKMDLPTKEFQCDYPVLREEGL